MRKLIAIGTVVFSLLSCSDRNEPIQHTQLKVKGDFYYTSAFDKNTGDTLFKLLIDFESNQVELFQSKNSPSGLILTRTKDAREGHYLINVEICKLKQVNGGNFKTDLVDDKHISKTNSHCKDVIGNYYVEYELKQDGKIQFDRTPSVKDYKRQMKYYESWFDIENLSFVAYKKDIHGLSIISSE